MEYRVAPTLYDLVSRSPNEGTNHIQMRGGEVAYRIRIRVRSPHTVHSVLNLANEYNE